MGLKKAFLWGFILLLAMNVSDVFASGDSGPISLAGVKIQILGSPGSDSRAYVYITLAADGCTNSTPVLLFDGSNKNPVANQIYSTLLAAAASDKKVDIQTTGCWSGWSTPVITSIYIYN